jgi:hypothetical protein
VLVGSNVVSFSPLVDFALSMPVEEADLMALAVSAPERHRDQGVGLVSVPARHVMVPNASVSCNFTNPKRNACAIN